MDVQRLIPLLRQGMQFPVFSHKRATHWHHRVLTQQMPAGPGSEINVLQVCKQKSTKTKTPKAASKAYNPFDESEDPVPISVDELMARRPGRTGRQSSQSLDAADDAEPVNEHEPKLNLLQLETGM